MIRKNLKNFRMKKLLIVLVLFLFAGNTFAQEPDKNSYRVTVKDENGQLVANKEITFQVSVFKGQQNGAAVFVEVHKTATDANGLASFDIGKGTAVQGTLAAIEWANGPFFIKTATDHTAGPTYQIVRADELLRIPTALIARQSETVARTNPIDVRDVSVDVPESINYKEPATSSAKDTGVPSQNWSLFGNSKSDPSKDKLGTTDFVDLVLVTNNLDRLRITANGDINIARSLQVGEDLRVNRNVDLNILGGATVNNGNFTVRNASATLLTGTLRVDGTTNLNSSLDVNNAAPTRLTGTLRVDGTTNLNSSLDVNNAAPTHLTGTLRADGTTNLNSSLNVNNAAATHLTGTLDVDQSLNVDGATTLQSTVVANGQVTINASLSGGDGSYAAYPLRVQGSGQGIAIKLSAGTPNNSNNFVTFFDSSGNPVGRIEGETTGEATSSPEFIFTNSILVAEEVKAGVNVGLAAIPVVVGGVIASTGPCGACIAMAAADLVLASANLVAYNVFALENIGVTYESGSADYAEWLERNDPTEKISAGDIVGVNGGKISKYTLNSKQYMVISTKPAMLGNMPADGQAELYEKVAFMGQVPVKVRGTILSGDYILPSGLNDGSGVAVPRDVITAEQYREVVGVAWSSSFIDSGVSAINMAIGLSANDVADLVVQQERKLKDLENKFSALEHRFLALENGTVDTSKAGPTTVLAAEKETTPTREMRRSETPAFEMPSELSDEMMEEAIRYLKNAYTTHGINFKDHAGLNKLFTDATYKAEIIKKAQERYRTAYRNRVAASKK